MPRPLSPSFRVTARTLAVGWVAGIFGLLTGAADAQQNGVIYTCTDPAGRRITSDRPIDSCMDREQRVLSSQGWLIKIIAPELTGAQRAAQQEQERQAQLTLRRQRDRQRGNEALLIRYPTQAAHEAGRRAALFQAQALLDHARRQLAPLENQRASLADQMAAYAPNPASAPAKLKSDTVRNAQAIETQQRLITGYQGEVDRINAQFDAEDKRLQPSWQSTPPEETAAAE